MSRFILFVKAFLICFIVSNGLMLASYLVYQFAPEWIVQNIFVYLLCNGSEIFQVTLICLFGYILCRNEVKKHGVTPAVSSNLIKQFIKQYGMMVLLLGVIVFMYPDSNFVRYTDFYFIMNGISPEGPTFFNIFKALVDYSLEPFQIFTGWLMFVVYGITKSNYQVKTGRELKIAP